MHNRVKAYLEGSPLPRVFMSKCQAIHDLHEDYQAGKEIILVVVWRGDGRPADPPPIRPEDN